MFSAFNPFGGLVLGGTTSRTQFIRDLWNMHPVRGETVSIYDLNEREVNDVVSLQLALCGKPERGI